MNTRLKWVIGIVVIFLVIWGIQSVVNKPQVSQEPIKIGVIASLTGKGAARGESAMMGLELAQKKIKEQKLLSGKVMELVYQDVSFDKAKNAPSAFNQLVEFEKVIAVIGPMGSNVALSVTPLVDGKQIPTIVHTASAFAVTENNEFVFRLWPTAALYSTATLPELEKRGYQKIGALSATLDNTIDFFNDLVSRIENRGIEVVIDERVAQDVFDFRTQLTKIAQANPDVIFLNLFEGQIGIAAKQARQIGIETPLFANSVTSMVELQVGQEFLEELWFPQDASYNSEIRDEFIELFGKEPASPDSSVAAHDALMVFAQTIAEVGTNPVRMKNYIYQNTFTRGINEIKFNSRGDASVPIILNIIRDGKIIDYN